MSGFLSLLLLLHGVDSRPVLFHLQQTDNKTNHWYQVQPLKSLGIHPGDVSCLAFTSLENSINPFGNILPFSPLKYLRFIYQRFKSERPALG